MAVPINLGSAGIVEGANPIVLVGANGVGKTRFGTHLVQSFSYDRISALRGLSLSNIPMQTPLEAKQQAENILNTSRTNTIDPQGDLPQLLSELKAEEAEAATKYRQLAISSHGQAGIPEATRLDTLIRLWQLVFPGRELDIASYQPKASWNAAGRSTESYSTSAMSDGERSALYLIARVLRARPGVVIIDEPELHFHSLLARQFWDVIEAEKTDCRFIYITHDLSFALSRKGRIGVVKSATEVRLIDDSSQIPGDLFESILGAASLSVVARRIIFCEGLHERSIDIAFYGAWFRAPHTVIVPVGSCDNVKRSFDTFKSTTVVRNVETLGIVEADYWPQSYLNDLKNKGLYVLSVHEVEGLLCIRSVAEAISEHLGLQSFNDKYHEFERNVKAHFKAITLNKTILERTKRDIDLRLIGLPNKAVPDQDKIKTRENINKAVDLARIIPDINAIFDEHDGIVTNALNAGAVDFLRILPGKDCLNILVSKIGISKKNYINLITNALLQDGVIQNPRLTDLGAKLSAAMSSYLPSRD